jgi:hypothetical protein
MYTVQCLHYKTVSNHFYSGGGGGRVKTVSRGDYSKEETQDFCLSYVQEFGFSKLALRPFDPWLDLTLLTPVCCLANKICYTERRKKKREVRKVNIPAGIAEGVGRGLDEIIKTTAKKRGPLPFTTDCMCTKNLQLRYLHMLLSEKDFDKLAK